MMLIMVVMILHNQYRHSLTVNISAIHNIVCETMSTSNAFDFGFGLRSQLHVSFHSLHISVSSTYPPSIICSDTFFVMWFMFIGL